jgi:hypothetical protein
LDGSHHSSDATISRSEENESVILLGNLRLRVILLTYPEFRGLAEFHLLVVRQVSPFASFAFALALVTSVVVNSVVVTSVISEA